MNKGILIAIAVIVLIGGAIGFTMMNKPKTATPETPTNTETSNGTMEVKSLRDLWTLGNNQTCTFSDTTTGNNGVVYVSSGSMRGDFTSMVNGTSTDSHMIVAGDAMHMWVDGQPSGFKSSLTQLENLGSNPSAPKTVDLDQQVDYDCNSWSVDASKFAVPSDIEFMDMSAMMESMPPTMMDNGTNTTPTSDQCAACDSLSGTYKTQCLQALNCN